MISDRLTAKVLGALLIILALVIDVSCFVFVKGEVRAKPMFPLVVIVPSLPLFALGAWLIRKGDSLEDPE